MIRYSALLLAALLCGCYDFELPPPVDVTTPFRPPAPFEVPFTGMVIGNPDFAHAPFETVAETVLRSGEEYETSVVADLPEGTPVVPVGTTGGECMCTRVTTPLGTGWISNREFAHRPFAVAGQ
jgi:hypothetical protein